MSASELRSLLRAAEKNPSQRARDALRRELLSILAEKEPAAAMAYAESLEPGARGSTMISVAQVWAQHDPRSALAWAEKLRHGPIKSSTLAAVVGSLALEDPIAAFEIAQRPELTKVEWDAGNLFHAWASRDPTTAMEQASSLADPIRRSQACSGLAAGWAESDPQSAFRWALSAGPRDRNNLVRAVMEQWAASDPATALDAARMLADGALRNEALAMIAAQWSGSDSTAALRAAENLRSEERLRWLESALQKLASQNPNETADYIHALADPAERNRLSSSIAAGLASIDTEAALRIAENIEPGLSQARAYAQIARTLVAERDPQFAIDWARSLPEGPSKRAALLSMATPLAPADPNLAGGVASDLPQGEARAEVVALVASRWANQDPIEAAKWLSTVSDDWSKGKAYKGLFVRWAQQNPEGLSVSYRLSKSDQATLLNDVS
jgi:hypothetical protein